MIDPASQALLQDLVRRESRSLLQYASESFPWITSLEQGTLAGLQHMVKEEQEAVARLVHFLARNHIVLQLAGPYPITFTNINYISLAHLLLLLVENQHKRVEELQGNLACIPHAESKQQVENFLTMKRRHLQSLQEMEKNLCRQKTQPA